MHCIPYGRTLPHFENQTQEAEWWANNQDLIADRFVQAEADGTLSQGSVAQTAIERALKPRVSP